RSGRDAPESGRTMLTMSFVVGDPISDIGPSRTPIGDTRAPVANRRAFVRKRYSADFHGTQCYAKFGIAAPDPAEDCMTAGTDTMRIAVIGAGGVGGAFGSALAKAGSDVTFLARRAHLAAMRERGLKVLGPRGDIHLQPTQATDDPASIGPVDVDLFCVKLWDVESAGAAIRPLVGKATAVIPLQNGIDASERLIPILRKDAVMGGVAQISATIAEP